MEGWIKLHRQFIEWEWYDDINTKVLFLHLLLKVNHKPWKWRGKEIWIWETLTWRIKLADETWLTVQQIRTSLNKLKSTNEITITSTKQFSIIKLNNWTKYQTINQQDNQQATNKQPTSNHKQECNNNINNIAQNLFQEFWKEYPTKKSKAKAEQIYKKIWEEEHKQILIALQRQKDHRKVIQDKWEWIENWKHPTTWLNQKCWEDEIEVEEVPERKKKDMEMIDLVNKAKQKWLL